MKELMQSLRETAIRSIAETADVDALEVVGRYDLAAIGCALLISPVWGKVELPELAKWILECNAPFRMQLQLHRIIWGDRRGV